MSRSLFRLLFVGTLLLGRLGGAVSADPFEAKTLPLDYNHKFSPKQLKKDLRFLVTQLETIHPNLYARISKVEFARHQKALEASFTEAMTRRQFYLHVQPLIASLRDGHTSLRSSVDWKYYRERGGLGFPLAVTAKGADLYVVANYGDGSQIAPGAKLLSINHKPIPALMAELLPLENAEKPGYRQQHLANYLGLRLFTHYQLGPEFTVEFLNPEASKPQTLVLKGVNSAAADRFSATPITGQPYSFHLLEADKIAVIDFRRCQDPEGFEKFLTDSFGQIQAHGIIDLIIDVRQNAGGVGGMGEALTDYFSPIPFRLFGGAKIKVSRPVKQEFGKGKYIEFFGEDAWKAPNGSLVTQDAPPQEPQPNPLRFQGHVYVLIGEGTFSNGMAFASGVKDYHLGTLIGEETGGLGSGFGEIFTFNLPATHTEVGVSTKHIFRPSWIDDGRGILPDIPVSQTVQDRAKGIDTAMAYTLSLIRSQRKAVR